MRVSGRVILGCLVLLALDRPGHVQHPDHGVGVVPSQHRPGVAVSSCHGGDGEALLALGEAVQVELVPLLDKVIVVRAGLLVVISRAVIVISDVVSVIIVWTVGSSHPLSIDALQNIFVGL